LYRRDRVLSARFHPSETAVEKVLVLCLLIAIIAAVAELAPAPQPQLQ
jgi:hypothetical protein